MRSISLGRILEFAGLILILIFLPFFIRGIVSSSGQQVVEFGLLVRLCSVVGPVLLIAGRSLAGKNRRKNETTTEEHIMRSVSDIRLILYLGFLGLLAGIWI